MIEIDGKDYIEKLRNEKTKDEGLVMTATDDDDLQDSLLSDLEGVHRTKAGHKNVTSTKNAHNKSKKSSKNATTA